MSTSTVPLTTVNRAGLVLAALLGLADIASAFFPTPDGAVGPPVGILVFGVVLGIVTIAGVVWAFRAASRGAVRVVAAARICSAITALPAFFVDISPGLRLLAAAILFLTVAVVVMILTPARRSDLVLD